MTTLNLNSNVIKKYHDSEKKYEKESDYVNLINYKIYNNSRAFDNLYIKYKKYIQIYAKTIYSKINSFEHAISLDDVFQNLIEKCFLSVIKKINIELIHENFSLKIFLSNELRIYSILYYKKYKKCKKINLDFELLSSKTKNHIYRNDTYNDVSSNLWRKWINTISYNPEDTYIFQCDNIKEKIRKNLSERENKMLTFLDQGYKLKQISETMNIPMGSIGALKKRLKLKVQKIMEV